MSKNKTKAIALISGGLDSLLAAKVIEAQGVEIQGVVFVTQFASRDTEGFIQRVKESSRDADIDIKVEDMSEEFLEVLARPEHGYGSQVNPCIDCKILMLRKAKKMMEKENADFVITGEVLGERPMSQRKEALQIIKKRSHLEGYLLRPLSAKLMEITVPEEKGLIDREKLYSISGRSRQPQFKLAKEYGLKRFFAPGGGCLLTDPRFAGRLKDLMERKEVTAENIAFLKYGRHFRLKDGTKVIVGRDEKENDVLCSLKKNNDIILRLPEKNGPDVILKGINSDENIKKAAEMVISHSSSKNSELEIVEYWRDETEKKEISVSSMAREEIEKMRV
ncbi:MAG: tRNA 4-thiouridine(8) synthase ThiI [Candidatus Omnitrophica bacterium]|nr:tRNA 4-thiouridine(8) synthase ThiI [Candidatus Omnitrophota bacterium]